MSLPFDRAATTVM